MNACTHNVNASTLNVAVVPSASGECGDPGVLGVASLMLWKLVSARTSISLNVLRYCRNVRPTWVKFDSKDTKESGVGGSRL